MTTAAVEILRSFDDLAVNEQWTVAREILRRLQESAQPVGDDELLAVADELFATMDAEEAGDGSTASGRNLAG
jgi:predicted HAD superfamily phosphohydrolase